MWKEIGNIEIKAADYYEQSYMIVDRHFSLVEVKPQY